MFGVCACVALLLSGSWLTRGAASGTEIPGELAPHQLVADDSLDPRLLLLELEGRDWERAVIALSDALAARDGARSTRDAAIDRLIGIRRELASTRQRLERVEAEAATLRSRVAAAEEVLRRRAVELYVSFGDAEDIEAVGAATSADESRRRQLTREVEAAQLTEWAALTARETTIGGELRTLRSVVSQLHDREAAAVSALQDATSTLDQARVALAAATETVRTERPSADIAGLGIPVLALDAYLTAERLADATTPECGIRWWTIAAVGQVESRHGRIGGRRLLSDGTTSSPIIGLVLDGRAGTRAVPDTDDGAMDGDGAWDRAVGPMQFIPETWRREAVDGDGDGDADPHNVHDAAATAGRLLCREDADLRFERGRRDALLRYNASDAYVEAVEATAARYRALVLPAGP